ncbi:MAG TPA: radical SAM protein [Myxococcota bacterium]|nr:radical SAM protein [Myxococcota bacterium]HQK52053.1 radical SAM protein [Myxococcota bacterium]
MPESLGQVQDLSDVMVDLILGYECNVQCDYCSITPEMRRHNLSTAEVIQELAHARSLGIRKAAFGGGEPTIRKDFLALARLARDRGFEELKVSSNGLLYSYREFARRTVEAGVTRFHVSVMAHCPDLYASILGRPDGLRLVEEGVRNLVDLGHVPVADLIIKNDTYRHLGDIVEYWAGRGIDTFALWLVSLSDRTAAFPDALPRVREMRDHIVEAFERGRRLGVTVYSRHIPRCFLKGYEEFCRDLRQDRVLVVTPGSRFFLWESAISPNAHVPACERCRLARDVCPGVRRDYLARHGDDEVDPFED